MAARLFAGAALATALLIASPVRADDPKPAGPEEQAIREQAAEFTSAFDRGDAKALAGYWAVDGDYVGRFGRHIKGRQAIEEAYRKLFADLKGAKLHITPSSVTVVRPDVVVEDGVTEVTPAAGGAPMTARYTAVHVKQDGRWYLQAVRETGATPPSNYEHLDDLEWLVGEWGGEADQGANVKATFDWAENRNFLVSTFSVALKDQPIAGATRWIGWDAAAKRIVSKSFDSDGGMSEGVWMHDGDNKWTIKTVAVMRDGKKLAATNIVTKVDDDHLTWKSIKRTLDDKAVPDSPEVKMKRVK